MNDDVVVIHTDGGCTPNPGPGGWGAVLRQREHVLELCGGEPGRTTNNRMELTAPIMALEALKRPAVVHLYTDSTYVRGGITKWVLSWERNGWMTSAKQPVKNVDLWQRLQAVCTRHTVEWHWVKGHAGVADNELADQLATRGMAQAMGRGPVTVEWAIADARVLTAIAVYGRPCSLVDLLAAADMVEHAVLRADEVEEALGKLTGAGLVRVFEGWTFELTEDGTSLWSGGERDLVRHLPVVCEQLSFFEPGRSVVRLPRGAMDLALAEDLPPTM